MKLKIFVLISLLIISSCDKPTEPTKTDFTNFRYPLEIGNKWVYHKSVTYTNISESLFTTLNLNSTGSVSLEVLILDSISTVRPSYQMLGITIDSVENNNADSAYFYYNNTDSGLVQYKYDGANIIVPISGHSILEQYIHSRIKKVEQKALIDDSKVAIKYPVKLNEEWRYTNIEFLFSINKKISKYDVLATQAGIQICFVVDWIYDGIDATITDYFSHLGLMKRVITIRNVIITDESNPDSNFTADVVEEYLLVEIVR